ncbi:MAG TPA: pantetheine-phosphate adenylyltransferase [Acidobacteriaceae bacterium]|nr:pantetheine-phosphate adenylyltransferase [Acidobacteriaceae bacterium]
MNIVKAIYPGSFDPLTNGHLDLIARAAKIFDHLVVAILRNSSKDPLFTIEERVAMLSEGIAALENVSISTFDGLLVDFAREQRAHAVVRGIRAISDYEYEFQMALMNRRLSPDVETIFLMPDAKYSFVSSRLVKEVFELGGSIDGLVPKFVIERLKDKQRS